MASEESKRETVQLYVPPVDPDKLYLGSAPVVQRFVSDFASAAIRFYDEFLSGETQARDAQVNIEALVVEYGGALMGRDPRYEIAPWQGERLRGKFLATIPSMKGDDDPGEAFFRHLSLQCVKSALALADGHDENKVGMALQEILHDARARILGLLP